MSKEQYFNRLDWRTHPRWGAPAQQGRITFPNGWCASVVTGGNSYTSLDKPYELAIFDDNGQVRYDTGLTKDVFSDLREEDVETILQAISQIPHVSLNKPASEEIIKKMNSNLPTDRQKTMGDVLEDVKLTGIITESDMELFADQAKRAIDSSQEEPILEKREELSINKLLDKLNETSDPDERALIETQLKMKQEE